MTESTMPPPSFSRRQALRLGGAAAALPLFNINHAWSADVTYDGGTFDAGGAVLNVAEWGGFWQDLVRKLMLDDFEKQFNCKVAWESAFPWFPKFVANPKDKPPFAIVNWNYPEMFKTAKAGDYFLPLEDVMANVPNTKNAWPFAIANKVGVTWAYARYCYAYRTDMAAAPVKSRISGMRAMSGNAAPTSRPTRCRWISSSPPARCSARTNTTSTPATTP